MPTATLNPEIQERQVSFDGRIILGETSAQEMAGQADGQSQKALGALAVPEFAPGYDTTPEEQTDPGPNEADELRREEYGRSLRRMRELGRAALKGEAKEADKEAPRRDWFTSLAEMLENAEKYRDKFEISDEYTYSVMDGQVMFLTADGPKPMEQMIGDGERKAWQAAATDQRMAVEARRAGGDVHNIVRVNEMVNDASAPNTRLGISRSLGRAFKKDPEFWKGKGYREDLPFIQAYYADRGRGTVSAGTLSMGGVSDETIDKVLAEHDVYMPRGDNDNGMRHGIEKTFNSKEEAMAWAESVRARCYELQGDTKPRMSVNDFIKARKQYLHAAFDSLCVPIAQAIESKKKNGDVQQFVSGLLGDTRNMDEELVGKLYKLAGKREIDDSDGRLLLGLSLYAAAEKLHKDAEALFANPPPDTGAIGPFVPPQTEYFAFVHPNQMIQQMTGHVHSGARAGRPHGGSCAGVVSVAGSKEEDAGLNNSQSAFGGLGANGEGSEERAESSESDAFGPLKFQCPKGHWNERRPAKSPKDFLPNCKRCGTSLSCKEPKAAGTEKPIFQSVGEDLVKFMAVLNVAGKSKKAGSKPKIEEKPPEQQEKRSGYALAA